MRQLAPFQAKPRSRNQRAAPLNLSPAPRSGARASLASPTSLSDRAEFEPGLAELNLACARFPERRVALTATTLPFVRLCVTPERLLDLADLAPKLPRESALRIGAQVRRFAASIVHQARLAGAGPADLIGELLPDLETCLDAYERLLGEDLRMAYWSPALVAPFTLEESELRFRSAVAVLRDRQAFAEGALRDLRTGRRRPIESVREIQNAAISLSACAPSPEPALDPHPDCRHFVHFYGSFSLHKQTFEGLWPSSGAILSASVLKEIRQALIFSARPHADATDQARAHEVLRELFDAIQDLQAALVSTHKLQALVPRPSPRVRP